MKALVAAAMDVAAVALATLVACGGGGHDDGAVASDRDCESMQVSREPELATVIIDACKADDWRQRAVTCQRALGPSAGAAAAARCVAMLSAPQRAALERGMEAANARHEAALTRQIADDITAAATRLEGQLEGTDRARCADVLAWARRRAAALFAPRCRLQVWSIKAVVGTLDALAKEGAGVGPACAQVVLFDGPC